MGANVAEVTQVVKLTPRALVKQLKPKRHINLCCKAR